MPGSNTIFEPLWVDAPGAGDEIQRRLQSGALCQELANQLHHLVRHGWVVIPAVLSEQEADDLSLEIGRVVEHPECFIARRQREAYAHPTSDIYSDPTMRLIDYHVNSPLARQAVFASPIKNFLKAAFEDEINAFQCLTFHYGSQQALHQDGAYVVVSKPLQFMASWIALEDVTEGSGELTYYSGSHKLDDFLFGKNSKSWNPSVHGREMHKHYLKTLQERSEAAGCVRETFLARKGDALIWASDLIHGGGDITTDATRRSLVTHYCPAKVMPNFSTFTRYFYREPVVEGCYISSRHYDLRPDRRGFLSKWFRRREPTIPFRKPAFMGKKRV
ncbi:MAG: phytanoyl-CoA dioxygenase family protein [Halioglobus sp.]|nr:phytanoyl-CoA dioxygenase family protein [Halioglobus sp.]